MEKHRLLVVGAGRIGAGFNWHNDAYTHAGAARALAERVELIAFVEPDDRRSDAACQKWQVPVYSTISSAMDAHDFDIASVCVQPEQQNDVMELLCSNHATFKGIWCEKPWVSGYRASPPLIQVNYLRRADIAHQMVARRSPNGILTVFAKDDIHTRCHFEDLAKWWKAKLEYRVFNGPCSYIYTPCGQVRKLGPAWFDNGGVNPAECMNGMLGNLLDAVEGKAELWSPPY